MIGFLDDDPQLVGKPLMVNMVYRLEDIGRLVDLYAVTDILLAMPAISRSRRNEILSVLRQYHVRIRSLPDLSDLAQGKATIADIHELDIVDLLGREPVLPNPALISRNIRGKVVMVTGAGGSIGSELCRQIIAVKPAKLLLLEHSEFSLYQIHSDLIALAIELNAPTELIPLLGSVRDYERVREVCSVWTPHTIFHAAAYKHVPLVEHNPAEGVRNNVFGTYKRRPCGRRKRRRRFCSGQHGQGGAANEYHGRKQTFGGNDFAGAGDQRRSRFENTPVGVDPAPRRTRFPWCDSAMCWAHPDLLCLCFGNKSRRAGLLP